MVEFVCAIGGREEAGCRRSGLSAKRDPYEGSDSRLGGRHELGTRTENIWAMFVTLDVSQPDMSVLKFFKLQKRQLKSVMSETHQSAMTPCFAVAEAASELYNVTASCKESLFVKVFEDVQTRVGGLVGEGGSGVGEGGGGDGGGGDGGDGSDGGDEGGGGEGDMQPLHWRMSSSCW